MIAAKFCTSDFSLTMLIHDAASPGIETMNQLKINITLEAENILYGAQLGLIFHDARILPILSAAFMAPLSRR
jgi:hypothetical protein